MWQLLVAALFLSGLCCFTPAAVAQPIATVRSDSSAQLAQEMLEAGSVRAQGQRLAKLYRQVGLDVQSRQANVVLTAGLALGEQSLRRLSRYTQLPAAARAYGRCLSVWQEFRAVVSEPYSAAAAERAGQLAEELAIHAGKLALQIEAGVESPAGRALDGAARLNMFAQRLARLYFQSLAGDRSQGLLTDLAQTRSEFGSGLLELERMPLNGQRAREALVLVRNQWIFLDEAVRQATTRQGTGRDALHVATSSERIEETLSGLAAQYREVLLAGLRAQ